MVSIISSHVTVTQYAHVHTILFQMLCQHGFLDLTPTPQVQLFMSNASMHTYLLSHAGMHIMCFANTDYHAISPPGVHIDALRNLHLWKRGMHAP